MNENSNNKDISMLRKRISVFIGVLIIFIIGGGVLSFFLMDAESTILSVKVNNESTVKENKTLSSRIERLKIEYEAIDVGYKCLDSLVMIQKLQVTEMLTSIQDMKVNDLAQKEKIKTLESQLTDYLAKIEELEGRNKILLAQYNVIKNSFDSVLNQNVAIANVKTTSTSSKDKSGVSKDGDLFESTSRIFGTSGKLMDYEIGIMTFRSENGRADVPTNKGSRVKKIRINFVLRDNQIASTGRVNIYYRILAPDGSVVTNLADKFVYNGKSYSYSARKEIEFYNKSQSIESFIEVKPLVKGEYIVDIFSDVMSIGTKRFTIE